MAHRSHLRFSASAAVIAAACLAPILPGSSPGQFPPPSPAVVIDRVIAVVNNQAILASEVDEEIRLAALDSGPNDAGSLTPGQALDQLISRELIRQQMRQEDVQDAAPSSEEVDARIAGIRRDSPACARERCDSDAKWQALLAGLDLNLGRVRSYLRDRMEILRFIEQRFRQGIRISPQEVETYYRETLAPKYPPGADIPPLAKVAPRIEQILLEQQVNAQFEDWLNNLRRQGEIEVLDPSLQTPETQAGAGEGTP